MADGGFYLYRASDLLKVKADIIAFHLRDEYNRDGFRTIDRRIKVHWKEDFKVTNEADISPVSVFHRYRPEVGYWSMTDMPFINEDLVRLTYGCVVPGFAGWLHDLLRSNGIKPVLTEETWT